MKKPTEQQIEQLRLDLQKTIGDHYQVQIIKTARFGGIWLVVITFPQEDWYFFKQHVNSVHTLHSNLVVPITHGRGYLRVMYTCQDYFVFYTPFCTSMFEQYEKAAAKNEVVVDEAGTEATGAYHHYYGTCDYIKKLLQFITETPRLYF